MDGRWDWITHLVQHWDDGYWTRYLGLYLDQRSCQRHFHKAKEKFKSLCHVLQRKQAPPQAKLLVYTLCLISQICYPAGLASCTLARYQKLDWTPNPLLRKIYGLRRTFPTYLIYAPLEFGGCGEHRISDAAQLQKWLYLNSVCHLSPASKTVVFLLLDRSLNAPPSDPTHYCTNLIQLAAPIGLSLSQSPYTPMPPW